jgi:hypothetical protein
MNILDENIPDSQRQLLRSWRIKFRQIGYEIGNQGIKDENIIPLLHRFKPATFFTRDMDFYSFRLCHSDYCLVCLDVNQYESASFIRRFLRHSHFNTKTKRLGRVCLITHLGIRAWKIHDKEKQIIAWDR